MSPKNKYLLVYNATCFCLWAYLTCRTLFSFPVLHRQSRLQDLYTDLLFPFLAGTQSLAALEILHAVFGVVRASPLTTAVQVGGKNLVVWTVMVKFPGIVSGKDGIWGFLGCLIAWGFSEVVRYGFFVLQLMHGDTPMWAKWLRYSAFIVLYPPGFLSEAWLVYLCLVRATDVSILYNSYLFVGLLAYIPAGYYLYTYMLSQRRRVLRQLSYAR
ncbi:tyrosine phosphatase-like protein [Whalleya microplaca]|nr:tyrosine phosphatase-like protein [Whalleya microplaca]